MTPAISLHATDGDNDGRHRRRRRRTGPAASAKWLTASIATTSQQVIASVFDHATQRDPTHRRTWIMLVDGARHQLDLIQPKPHGAASTSTSWSTSSTSSNTCGRPPGASTTTPTPPPNPGSPRTPTGSRTVHTDGVITTLQAQAATAGLTRQQRGGVDACIGYLTAKRAFLGYATALARGWPIATGVIEGACRHLIGDRLDITGARWGLQDAEAVLKLRALHTNGDLDAYWRFHLAQQHRRVHQARYQHPPAQAA